MENFILPILRSSIELTANNHNRSAKAMYRHRTKFYGIAELPIFPFQKLGEMEGSTVGTV